MKPGTLVTDGTRVGITTSEARKSGDSKGLVSIQWAGDYCQRFAAPEDLTPLDVPTILDRA